MYTLILTGIHIARIYMLYNICTSYALYIICTIYTLSPLIYVSTPRAAALIPAPVSSPSIAVQLCMAYNSFCFKIALLEYLLYHILYISICISISILV